MQNRHSALCTLHSAFCIDRRVAGQALVEYAIVFPLQLLLTLVIIQLAHLFVAKQVIEYSAFCAARAALSDPDDYDGQRRAALVPLSAIAGRSGVNKADFIWIPGRDAAGNAVGWGGRAASAEVYRNLRRSIEDQLAHNPSAERRAGLQKELNDLDIWYSRSQQRASEGYLAGSGAADEKTDVSVTVGVDGKMMIADVTHQFELSIPIGNAAVYQLGEMFPGLAVDRSTYGAPHWEMKGSCTLARPWGE
jgi:hypothetical protein